MINAIMRNIEKIMAEATRRLTAGPLKPIDFEQVEYYLMENRAKKTNLLDYGNAAYWCLHPEAPEGRSCVDRFIADYANAPVKKHLIGAAISWHDFRFHAIAGLPCVIFIAKDAFEDHSDIGWVGDPKFYVIKELEPVKSLQPLYSLDQVMKAVEDSLHRHGSLYFASCSDFEEMKQAVNDGLETELNK